MSDDPSPLRRGHRRGPRRPPGWVAPGPAPIGAQGDHTLVPSADEDLSYLAGDWRLFQPRRGHRWSLDDLVTADLALRMAPDAARIVDLGTGLGSVLLLGAWARPRATLFGIEAQASRAERARRSIRYNGVGDRCQVVGGDFRTALGALPRDWFGAVDLVTGTPPYFPPGTTTEVDDAEARACRVEERGGVDDYVASARQLLSPAGTFVMCYPAFACERVSAATRANGMRTHARVEVFPREGKPALIFVDAMQLAHGNAETHPIAVERLVVRDRAGQWSPQFQGVRARFGMPTRV